MKVKKRGERSFDRKTRAALQRNECARCKKDEGANHIKSLWQELLH
jgi:hypothetical protein